jgi:hypothetical protein
MPRPMRERFLRAPGRSESSCSFIAIVLVLSDVPGLAKHRPPGMNF